MSDRTQKFLVALQALCLEHEAEITAAEDVHNPRGYESYGAPRIDVSFAPFHNDEDDATLSNITGEGWY